MERKGDMGNSSRRGRLRRLFRRPLQHESGRIAKGQTDGQGGLSSIPTKLILIVELSGCTYGPLAQQLEQAGYQAQVVRGKTAALDVLAQEGPALSIVVGPADPDFYRELRRASSSPILALASRADEEQMLSSFSAGVDEFIRNPVSLTEVVARIGALLRRAP
jgi:DNA-binding response OmpR family regulator